MLMKRVLFLISLLLSLALHASEHSIKLEKGEVVWGGLVKDGSLMPYDVLFSRSLRINRENQAQPLLITNKGQYVWSDAPFSFTIETQRIHITDAQSDIYSGKAGESLSDVYRYVSQRFFPSDGTLPPIEFFEKPQYNTWIELMYDQNQEGVINYAREILNHGLPPGIIMIDDTWQEDYGNWVFHPGRFPDPKAMVAQLHEWGFKVMLWICPFVSMDQYLICREINSFKGFLLWDEAGSKKTWSEANLPYPVRWWNGTSAVLDFSNERSVEWFDVQLQRLMTDYGVDGFKFDAGDFNFYPSDALSKGHFSAPQQCESFAKFGLKYPFNEYRACWKMAGRPLVQRLHDKAHSWADLQKLIPEMLAQNMMGYTFSCPDMVGGGSFETFLKGEIDQELIVRSAQCHALMTMMQFSLAPWRVLDKQHYEAVLKAVDKRSSYIDTIISLAKQSARSGEPIMRPMEYVFPHSGYESIIDQFMLGDSLLVAPLLQPGVERTVVLPEGEWLSDDGTRYVSPKSGLRLKIHVPIDRLPTFKLL